MKKNILFPAFLCIGIGAATAQSQKTASPASAQGNTVVIPAQPSTGGPKMNPVTKPQTLSSRQIAEQEMAATRKNNEALQKRSGVKDNRSFHPNDGSGMITIDFGIVKQGDIVNAFFPANFETLESKESLATHNMTTGDFIKFIKLTPAEGISAVKLARGEMIIKDPSLFRGFDVEYNTQKASGKVDEVVEVFTHQGNLQLRITGFVANKDTELSMK